MSKASSAKAAKKTKLRSAVASKPGEINIVGLFEAEAAALLQAAERGLILHKTHNIRDSGALLESTFRQIIGMRLPPQAQMAHGYLYDLESTCTPQVDAMVLSATDNYPMMSAEADAIYAPFTSCRAYVEIKSSTGRVVKTQLDQAAKISKRIANMAATLGSLHERTAMPKQVGSVLLFANSCGAKAKPFSEWFKRESNGLTLVVFLDKAVVISRRSVANESLTWDDAHTETLLLSEPFNGKEAWLYKPQAKTASEARGLVLLWLYYWLLYCGTKHEVERAQADREDSELLDSTLAATGTQRVEQSRKRQLPPVSAFIDAANRRFPLFAVKKLADFKDLIPDFENC